ncbi:MAG: carbamoyltransferase HypF [Chloroflexi bacterium]|nr:carbamoyltransferase HypF [Chloroflexota bacterium]
MNGARIHITGIVQGVGFRPFVYNLAEELGLNGWVRNTSAGVDIQVDGDETSLADFARLLRESAPPLALIASLDVDACASNGFSSFEIVHSEPIPGAFQPISPDVSICDDCVREMFDPKDRRYLYPFINCTNCGPRLTIIKDIPYDRPKTTMAPFDMCPACAAEYADPKDRRFHAQPVACAECGPHVWLEMTADRRLETGDAPSSVPRPPSDISTEAIQKTQQFLLEGKIIAIKGLGGFHLACDATNTVAVDELRRRKLRVDKPFALMMPDIETIEQHCFISEAERELLESPQHPIVLLWRRHESTIADVEASIAEAVAPGQNTLGVMLPYTPLHYLLFENDRRSEIEDRSTPCSVLRPPSALVMTSGNLSEEPIATDNEEARERLSTLADAFLMHNRDIHVRCDDSVYRVVSGQWEVDRENPTHHPLPTTHYPLRRSRGYAPYPIVLPIDAAPILAAGPELKNTFCLTKDRYAFISHHIGDLENYETLRAFEDGIEHFERLFRIAPKIIAYDLHPNYMATRYALERAENQNIPVVGVQHHHAHIASCMADHGLKGDKPVIGISFDGTGYGDDGAIWGGEFLFADYYGYHRFAHLAYTPLPGGDKAIKEPWRMALSWLHTLGIEWDEDLPPVLYSVNSDQSPVIGDQYSTLNLEALHHQLNTGTNAPSTSSMGRLFDAVAALAGVRQTVNYEAQAAIEFEALADPDEKGHYQFTSDDSQFINPAPMFQGIISDLKLGMGIPTISARFHNGLAQMVADVSLAMRSEFDINTVVLSGGVWQNITLLNKSLALLYEEDFDVLIHKNVPANDGGISLGQAMIAAHQFQ